MKKQLWRGYEINFNSQTKAAHLISAAVDFNGIVVLGVDELVGRVAEGGNSVVLGHQGTFQLSMPLQEGLNTIKRVLQLFFSTL